MRIAVLVNTPAHAHTYRHAVSRLEERGHDVLVFGREYACTTDLLEFFDMPYVVYGTHETSPYSKPELALELGGQLRGIARETRRFKPDLVFGRGPYAAFAGTLARARTVLVLDDEPSNFNHTVARPFADTILTPEATRRDLGSNHYTFRGFKECAYLHPDVYEPAADVRDRLGLDEGERYVLARFNAFDALHDAGVAGFTPDQRRELVTTLAEEATVIVSDEGGEMDLDSLPARRYDLHPALMHDAIREAELLVGDTGTMCIEAGLLGTPAIRNEDTGEHEIGEFAELESAGLVDSVETYEQAERRALELLRDEGAKTRRRERSEAYLGGLTNLTEVLVDVAETHGTIDRIATERTGIRPKKRSTP